MTAPCHHNDLWIGITNNEEHLCILIYEACYEWKNINQNSFMQIIMFDFEYVN